MLKLVMTATPVVTSAPYSIPLPIREQKIAFSFQVPAPGALSLEFSLYPNFGTKTIGRATALPYLFQNIQNSQAFTLPILDPRLHVIGEASPHASDGSCVHCVRRADLLSRCPLRLISSRRSMA